MATGNYPNALRFYLDALKKFESVGDNNGVSHMLANVELIYYFQGEIRKAMDYTFQSKKIAERANDDTRLLAAILNFGNHYENLDILDSARNYTNLAYEDKTALHRDNQNKIKTVFFYSDCTNPSSTRAIGISTSESS